MRARRRLGGKLLSQEVVRNSTEPHSALDIAHRAHRAFLHTRGFRPCAKSALPKKPELPRAVRAFACQFFFLFARFLPVRATPRSACRATILPNLSATSRHNPPAHALSSALSPRFFLPQIPLQSSKIQFFYKKALFLFRARLVYPLQTSIPF